MAIKTREEMLASLKGVLGDNVDDTALGVLEDFEDTMNDIDTRLKDSTDWKKKYEENDADWRKKYRDRFYSNNTDDDNGFEDSTVDKKPALTFENLFK